MVRLHRALGDVLLWLAVLLGILWLLIWVDVAPGASSADVRIPAGLERVAAFSALALLLPGLPTLAAWLLGLGWARLGALAVGAVMIATSQGWTRVDDVSYLRWVSVVAGVATILYTSSRVWPALGGRGDTSPLIARIGMGLLLVVVLACAVTAVVVGWSLGLVNRHPGDGHGLYFLVPGLAVAGACLGLGRHFFPSGTSG